MLLLIVSFNAGRQARKLWKPIFLVCYTIVSATGSIIWFWKTEKIRDILAEHYDAFFEV